MSDRIDYYPVKVSPNKPVWEVDYRLRTDPDLLLPTVRPPIEYRWRKSSQRRNGGKLRPPAKPLAPMSRWRKERAEEALATAVAAEPEPKRGKEKPRDKVRRPAAIVPCYVYPGFRNWDDYHRMMTKSEELELGLQGLVGMSHGNPYRLTPGDVAFLQSITETGTERARTQIHKSIKPGETVKIAGTAFEGWHAKLERIDDARDLAEVWIEFLGSMRLIPVPLSAIGAA
jgi:transcription antitermination factor NusG